MGVEALESGWITSAISRNCNNLGGVCSSSSHPSNGCGSNSNCSFAYFKSVNEFVDYHANMLSKNYLMWQLLVLVITPLLLLINCF